jgi:hypothetical protein
LGCGFGEEFPCQYRCKRNAADDCELAAAVAFDGLIQDQSVMSRQRSQAPG